MRLIDADKIRYSDMSDGQVPGGLWYTFKETIDKTPTVKAIPKEWIEKWLEAQERIVLISPPYYNQVRVPKMLEDWEEENEESN